MRLHTLPLSHLAPLDDDKHAYDDDYDVFLMLAHIKNTNISQQCDCICKSF